MSKELLNENVCQLNIVHPLLFVPTSERKTVKIHPYMEKNLSKDEKNQKSSLKEQLEKIYQKIQVDQAFKLQKVNTDDDNEYEPEEFEKWKRRELKRRLTHLNKGSSSGETIDVASGYPLGCKNSSPENRDSKPAQNKKIRSKMKFLQKYYHKGAYFQTNSDERSGPTVPESLYGRDFWESTPEDNFDKTLLPSIMQVKNFGRRGRTKWTHLVSEDTSICHQLTAGINKD
eukprot:gnl/MRDRNA2_/MRDRNA2_60137_c0_seq1.p1 gnl/MRDRNA2_/MRDRNA2_60137_c0~~gnl/MRDRNA2_/MRDRNA2_60137_c0_seq1.p1  ORF type:complete len:230 (+),score=22.89 gnl/MRDRNA2_/MRDRNA2_60137_c0_seq1:124-813(+)